MNDVELVEGRWPVVLCSAPDCRARVVWAVSERGKPTMIDADPTPNGNILLVGSPFTHSPTAVVHPAKLAFGRTNLRKSHFATCPAARRFRKPRGHS